MATLGGLREVLVTHLHPPEVVVFPSSFAECPLCIDALTAPSSVSVEACESYGQHLHQSQVSMVKLDCMYCVLPHLHSSVRVDL